MLKRMRAIRGWCTARLARLNPHKETWHGMGRALRYGGWAILAATALTFFMSGPSLGGLLGMILVIGMLVLGIYGTVFLFDLIARARQGFQFGLLLTLVGTLLSVLGFGPLGVAVYTVWVVLILCFLGGSYASWRRLGWRWHNATFALTGSVACIAFLVWHQLEGWQVEEDIHWRPIESTRLELPDPGLAGDFEIRQYFYGPGTDRHRDEFGSEVDFLTETVDGSKLLDGWSGGAGWSRTRYWDAEPDRLPVRGRVHVPDGPGPFPVVLIVHGNHSMEDYSDDGYDYLTEHFASRGVIAASVDQNVLNSSTGDLLGLMDGGLDEENDARGWLLLEHLRQWRDWNAEPGHAFFGRVDLDRVVLIGHSRGGEAVSEAALFNRLSAYPDDATLSFGYGFGLRGVIAIAPVDHQYKPRNRDTVVTDTNYLVVHGSHDGDVTAYAGFATYSRARFDRCMRCFKAGFYLIGANHGQFNTGWGRYDMPSPRVNLYNLDPIMAAGDQRAVARTLFSAFLEAVLNDDDRYRRFLAAPDRAHHLFPENARYLSHFRDASDVVLADFEEDADVATATLDGGRWSASGLALWKESEVPLKWRDTDTAAVTLGWHVTDEEAREPAEYRLTLPDIAVTPASTLALSVAMSKARPGEVDDYEVPDAVDFTLLLEDRSGQQASLALTARRPVLPQVTPRLYKMKLLNGDAASEVVFQRYRFEFQEWLDVQPRLDLAQLESVILVFDRTPTASILIDDVVLSRTGL